MKIALKIEGVTEGSEAECLSEKLIAAFHNESKVSILGVNAKVARYEARHYETVTNQPLSSKAAKHYPPGGAVAEFELYIVD